jgi:sarcosine oxidase
VGSSVVEDKHDVIVVGVGAWGSATCHQLASRGYDVLGIDRYEPPHDHGSSHGRTRVMLRVDLAGGQYLPLMAQARELWRELEVRSGRHLFDTVSTLSLGIQGSQFVDSLVSRYDEQDTPHEVLGQRELARDYPAFRTGPDTVGVLEDGTIVLRPEAAIEAQIELARWAGAGFLFGQTVLRWGRDGARLYVETRHGRSLADRLVITAGAWSGDLTDLDIALKVERQVTGWFAPLDQSSLGSLPVFICSEGPSRVWLYGVPDLDGDGVKAVYHHGGQIGHPDSLSRTVGDGDLAELRSALRRWIPDLDSPPRRAETCMYTNTPDLHYAIGPYPGSEGVFVAGGGSGHGFRLSVVVGEILADLVGGVRRFDLSPFDLGRLVPAARSEG